MSAATYTEEVAHAAEDLVRQGPPETLKRATWTLETLGVAIAKRFAWIDKISHESVRRLLVSRGTDWRRAKAWITSPDPQYDRRKRRRDRLSKMARTDPDGAAVWFDESWFVRWPYAYWAWAPADDKPRVPKRWFEEVERTALYATLDDETQEAFLQWTEAHPNSETTVTFLEALMAYWATKGKRYIVLFWDKASWHTSNRTTTWIRAYNRRAKEKGLPRLIVCTLPTRSPWLNPLEPVFGSVKHRVLGDRVFDTIPELQTAAEYAFLQRVTKARKRRELTWDRRLAA